MSEDEDKLVKKKYGYWYEIHYQECPVCGKSKEYRMRKYTTKPKVAAKRYFYEQVYDWCERY